MSHLIGRRGESAPSPCSLPPSLSAGDGRLHAVPMLFMPRSTNLNCNLERPAEGDPAPPLHLSVPLFRSLSAIFHIEQSARVAGAGGRRDADTEPETEIHALTRRENSVPMVLRLLTAAYPPSLLSSPFLVSTGWRPRTRLEECDSPSPPSIVRSHVLMETRIIEQEGMTLGHHFSSLLLK